MVNIYIVTKKQDIFNKLEEGFSNTAYMEITSFKMENLDELVERIDNFKDVDIALISEDILEETPYIAIDDKIVKKRNIPYLIINTSDKILMDAIHSNAQDIIILNNLDIDRAVCSILHSLERNKMINRLYEHSIEDELTGLYNRRGFLKTAEETIKLLDNKEYCIMFIDLDKMKDINDKHGHDIGDRALILTSKVLSQSFREADIISRFGGDEFVVFISNAKDSMIEKIKERIFHNLEEVNKQKGSRFTLSLSIGVAKHSDNDDLTLNQIINNADSDMYKIKVGKYK